MKRFLARIIICLVPTLLSLGVVAYAYNEYQNGRGGFVLGVDLVGGTILVYEVDESKMTPEAQQGFKIEDLAAALKRRIDPADLYNITIRPVPGSPPRVEIILPTGGKHQADIERQKWEKVLADAALEYPVKGNREPYADIPREGGRGELVDRIASTQRAEIEAWVKEQTEPAKGKAPAWKTVLAEAAKKYPADREDAYANIPDGDRATLIARIADVQRRKADAWVESQTGAAGGKGKKMLTGDEVENIKNLIARQGRLEFRILANSTDDRAAMDAATEPLAKMNKEDLARHKASLAPYEQKAEPPPGPRDTNGSTSFPVNLPDEPNHAYSWVEIGKSYLWSLGLNSDSVDKNPRLKAEVDRAVETGVPFRLGNSLIYAREITDWSRRLLKDRQQGKRREFFILVRDPIKDQEITGDYLVRATQGNDSSGRLTVDFVFNDEGGRRFYDVTTRNRPSGGESGFKRQLAIIFDAQVSSAPALQSPIRTNGQITGDFTQNEIDEMLRLLRAGALPATLKKDPVSENSMGATLGEETIKWGFWSVVGAFVAVMAFMVFYYRFAGLVACVALFANLLLTVAFMVLVQAAFTLPGLAGLVLMLGMAVDANVLIYERLREERERGASLALALRNGYDRAFPTIIDTHLSSIFTAIVLYVVGNDQLKGFGITLTVGLIISLFTSLYMTRTIFDIWFSKGWLKDLNFFGGLVRLIHARYWDFMSIRHYWFTGTVILTVLGAALFIYRADSDPASGKATVLNIDFTGGTAFTGQLDTPMTIKELREALDDRLNPLPDLSVQQLSYSGEQTEPGKTRFFEVRTSEKDAPKVLAFISSHLEGKLKLLRVDKIDITATDGIATAATLTFKDADNPGYASPAQVQRVVAREFLDKGRSPSSFDIIRPRDRDLEKDGHYSQLTVRLLGDSRMPEKDLRDILKAVQQKFADSPQPERLEVFDKQLAGNTQERALYAILASWGAILLYLWFRFGSWTFGAAAVCCLIHDLLFTLGIIAACHYLHAWVPGLAAVLGIQDFKIDLPAVAALLTLVGYSVNDTIVVFDRIREVRGKNPLLTPQMINDSVNQTLTRTILASTTVFVVVLVLYVLGGEGVKLFAFVMIVGVIIGTYSSIYIASPLLLIFGEGRQPSPAALDRAPAATERG